MVNKTPYSIDYAIKRLRQAVELAEIEGNFTRLRIAVNDLEEAINADAVYTEMDEDSRDQQDTTQSIISTFHPI